MNKALERTLRLKIKPERYSQKVVDYYFEYINSKSPKDNYVKNIDWIIGFGEFVEGKLKNKTEEGSLTPNPRQEQMKQINEAKQ